MATLVPIKDIKVDAEGFRQLMHVYAAVLGKTGGQIVKQQAALLASDLLNYTLPVEGTGGGRKGVSMAARGVGEATLERDVTSIFKPLHKASYEQIADNDDFSVFAAWVQDRWSHQKKAGIKRENLNPDGWTEFKALHGGKGRGNSTADFSGVNKGEGFIRTTHVNARGGNNVQNYTWNVRKNKTDYFVDGYERKIPAYLKEAEKRVGRLKSGWAEACRSLGKKPDSAAWIDRNQSGHGYAVDESNNSDTPTVTIANRIHFLMGTGAGTTLWKSAFHYRAFAMRSVIARILTRRAGGNAETLEKLIQDLKLGADQFQIE